MRYYLGFMFSFLSLDVLGADYKWLEDCYQGKVSPGKIKVVHTVEGYELSGEWKECYERGLEIAEKNANDTDMVVNIAKLTAKSHSQVAAIPVYRVALENSKNNKLCDDGDLRYSTIEGLKRVKDDRYAKDAKWIAFSRCWSGLKEPVVAEIAKHDRGSYFHENTCKDLVSKKALSGLKLKKCQ